MHFPADRIGYTTAFDVPVVNHRLERKITRTANAPVVQDRSGDPNLCRSMFYRLSDVQLLLCLLKPLQASSLICIPVHIALEAGMNKLISIVHNLSSLCQHSVLCHNNAKQQARYWQVSIVISSVWFVQGSNLIYQNWGRMLNSFVHRF